MIYIIDCETSIYSFIKRIVSVFVSSDLTDVRQWSPIVVECSTMHLPHLYFPRVHVGCQLDLYTHFLVAFHVCLMKVTVSTLYVYVFVSVDLSLLFRISVSIHYWFFCVYFIILCC